MAVASMVVEHLGVPTINELHVAGLEIEPSVTHGYEACKFGQLRGDCPVNVGDHLDWRRDLTFCHRHQFGKGAGKLDFRSRPQ